MHVDWNVWKPRLLYGGFFALAFALSLRLTFPSEAMKERLIVEAGERGFQVDVDRVGPAGVVGVAAEGLTLEDRSGLKIPIDEARLSLRFLPLLVGNRTLDLRVKVWDGDVRGEAALSGPAPHYTVEVSGLDLARALPLKKASGLDLAGVLSGTVDVTVPDSPTERPTGRVDLTVKGAAVNGGQLPVGGMGGLTLPRVAFGDLAIALALRDGRGTFEKVEAKGGDADLTTEGLYFVLQPRLEFAPVFGKARVKVQDAAWSKAGMGGFRSLAEMALGSSKDRSGAWQLQIYGTVGHPQVRPVSMPGGG
jgi:type II secretion system protein N